MPEDFSPSKIDLLGSLRVIVYRAKSQKRDEPHMFNGAKPKVVDELPERLLKGREMKNNVRYERSSRYNARW